MATARSMWSPEFGCACLNTVGEPCGALPFSSIAGRTFRYAGRGLPGPEPWADTDGQTPAHGRGSYEEEALQCRACRLGGFASWVRRNVVAGCGTAARPMQEGERKLQRRERVSPAALCAVPAGLAKEARLLSKRRRCWGRPCAAPNTLIRARISLAWVGTPDGGPSKPPCTRRRRRDACAPRRA